MKKRRTTAHADAGFTLLELMVVLALMAGATALAAPLLAPSRLAVPAAARDVASLMQRARAEAVQSNAERTVTIDLAGRRAWRDGGADERTFAQHLMFDVTTIASERPSATLARVRFYPDGSATGGEVKISDAHGRAGLRIDWLTGAARVVEGAR